MKAEQKVNANGLNLRQQRFAELVVSGMSATQAYKDAGYESTGNAAEVGAARLIRNPKVESLIAKLRGQTSEKLEFKRQNLVEHLWAAVTTPASEVTASSPLAQEVIYDKEGKVVRVKAQGKLESARLLCEMMGWKEPEQIVVETGPKTLEAIAARAASVVSALDASLMHAASKA